MNASDDRGINTVRGPILNFASTRTIFKSGFKLVILDEADAMTHDAQNALRRSQLCLALSHAYSNLMGTNIVFILQLLKNLLKMSDFV